MDYGVLMVQSHHQYLTLMDFVAFELLQFKFFVDLAGKSLSQPILGFKP